MREGTFCKMGLQGIHSAHVMVYPSHFCTPMWTAAHFEIGSSLIDLKSAEKTNVGLTQNEPNNEAMVLTFFFLSLRLFSCLLCTLC